jgi:hypothetical protein
VKWVKSDKEGVEGYERIEEEPYEYYYYSRRGIEAYGFSAARALIECVRFETLLGRDGVDAAFEKCAKNLMRVRDRFDLWPQHFGEKGVELKKAAEILVSKTLGQAGTSGEVEGAVGRSG